MSIDVSQSEALPCAPHEVVITRVLHAPRQLVWQAMTDPEHVVQWWGPVGFTTITEKHEFRVGGVWKHVMIGPDGARYPAKSVFTAIHEPELVSYTHGGAKEGDKAVSFEASWLFEEINAWTTRLTMKVVFANAEDRNYVVEHYGALEGGRQTLARLDEFLAQRAAVVTSREVP